MLTVSTWKCMGRIIQKLKRLWVNLMNGMINKRRAHSEQEAEEPNDTDCPIAYEVLQ